MRVPSKVKIFVWRSFHESIPTMVNLWNHHVPVYGNCPICKEEVHGQFGMIGIMQSISAKFLAL